MAKQRRDDQCSDKRKLSDKISAASSVCRTVARGVKKIAAAYRKHQLKQYKKYAKFNKKTGFWKLKALKKVKKSKYISYKKKK